MAPVWGCLSEKCPAGPGTSLSIKCAVCWVIRLSESTLTNSVLPCPLFQLGSPTFQVRGREWPGCWPGRGHRLQPVSLLSSSCLWWCLAVLTAAHEAGTSTQTPGAATSEHSCVSLATTSSHPHRQPSLPGCPVFLQGKGTLRLVRGDQQVPARLHGFGTSLFMARELGKQGVMSSGRYSEQRATCWSARTRVCQRSPREPAR